MSSCSSLPGTITPCIEDQIEVGSPAILSSPHISEGPGRIAKSPVPSVYADDRGDIHRLRVGGKRINLLYSKKEVMRSGYFSPHLTHDFVVSGKVELWTLSPSGTDKVVYTSHQYIAIPAYIPHILYFLEDTVLVEWYEKGTEFQCYYYHPYRNIVDLQNSIYQSDSENNNQQRKTGRNQRLVPQDDIDSSKDGDHHHAFFNTSSRFFYNNNGDNTFSSNTTTTSTTTSSYFLSILQSTFMVGSVATIAFASGLVIGFLLNDNNNNNNNTTASNRS